jgi:hypothetical protein
MRTRFIVVAVLAAFTLTLALPRVGSAQGAPANCLPGAPEAAIPDSWTRFHLELRSTGFFFFSNFTPTTYWVWVPLTWNRVTYYNYRNVTDVFYARTQNPNGTISEAWGFPAYLLQAYGGNVALIQQDLQSGALRNRGPCV